MNDYEVLSIQFDLVEEENARLRKYIKYLEEKSEYYEELVMNYMSGKVMYPEYDGEGTK